MHYSLHLCKILRCDKSDFKYVVMLFGAVVPMTICLSSFQESIIYCYVSFLMYLSVATALNLADI